MFFVIIKLHPHLLVFKFLFLSYYSLSPKELEALAEEIVQLFPKELKQIYYVPHKSVKDGKPIRAKGKLHDHYFYMKRELKKDGILIESEKFSPTSSATTSDISVSAPVLSAEGRFIYNCLWYQTRIRTL